MSSSLQDQLLAAGLVKKKDAKRAEHDKRKQKKRNRGKPRGPDESSELARHYAAREAARARELNEQRQQAARRKAVQAEVKQLAEQHKVARDGAEIPYQFTHGKRIRQIMVTEPLRQRLVAGQLAVIAVGQRYHLVPDAIAARIAERAPESVLVRNASQPGVGNAQDDPYADYQVPDDLIW